jgi:predicted PurR-regulated permease PerM
MTDSNERAGGWLSPSAATFAGRVVILIALVGVAALLLQLTGLFLLLFAAIVLAVVFDAMARLIRRLTYLPRGW